MPDRKKLGAINAAIAGARSHRFVPKVFDGARQECYGSQLNRVVVQMVGVKLWNHRFLTTFVQGGGHKP